MDKPPKKKELPEASAPAPKPKLILDLNNLSENPLPPAQEKIVGPGFEQNPKEKKVKGLVDQHGNPISSREPKEEWSGKKVEKKKEKISDERKADIAKLKTLKKEIAELSEKYVLEMQREDKAIWYSKLEEKQKEYNELEIKLETPVKLVKESEPVKETTPEPEKKTEEKTLEQKPVILTTPHPEFAHTPEDTSALDDLRENYLKAKRLRGNVLRGGIGGFFRRTLNFGGEEMKFGGKKGAEELEKVRHAYQLELSKHRSKELSTFHKTLEGKTEAERDLAIKSKIIELLDKEQLSIDEKSVSGIEQNFWEKIKTKFRQKVWTRTGVGAGLAGIAALTAGTGTAAVAIGGRAVMGGAGVYLGTEAQIERWSKGIGHKGSLLSQMRKDLDKIGTRSVTGQEAERYIANIPKDEIKKEAARLRMLQVEKGVAIDKLRTSGDDGTVTALIIKRDHEITAEEAASIQEKNPTIKLADMLAARLTRELNLRNELVEKEVDRERINKMKRKTLAGLAGAATGWIIGGGLFEKPELPTVKEEVIKKAAKAASGTSHEHVVKAGENTWKIIAADLDSHKVMDGLTEGPRTYMVDALKDKFEAMTPKELKAIGFTSGDIDLLKTGDSLVLDKVLSNPKIMADALFQAKYLNPKLVIQIVNNNREIADWLVNHSEELKQVYDGKVIEEVLRGIR